MKTLCRILYSGGLVSFLLVALLLILTLVR